MAATTQPENVQEVYLAEKLKKTLLEFQKFMKEYSRYKNKLDQKTKTGNFFSESEKGLLETNVSSELLMMFCSIDDLKDTIHKMVKPTNQDLTAINPTKRDLALFQEYLKELSTFIDNYFSLEKEFKEKELSNGFQNGEKVSLELNMESELWCVWVNLIIIKECLKHMLDL